MKPYHPTHTLFTITILLATITHFPILRSQQTQPYDICGQSVQCGDIKFEYPFWGLGRPEYCGHPGFELTCESNVTQLNLGSVDYRVLADPDSSTHTISIARNDLWDEICPQYLHNTTYDSALFNGGNSGQEDVSLYYRCQENVPGVGGTPLAANYRFSCTVNQTQSESYFVLRRLVMDPGNFLVRCNDYITVPVTRSSADRLANPTATVSDLQSALRDGFGLQWSAKNDECERCVNSEGRCGSNETSPDSFVCYCATGNVSLTCNNSNETGGGSISMGATRKLIIGFSSCAIGIMLLFFILLCRRRMLLKSQKATSHNIEMLIKNNGTLAPKRFKYSEIKIMTKSFLLKLGQGGYGSVYKGELPDGQLVAVKLLSDATEDGEDFINEVASISKTSHVNVVTLLGFCIEGKKRALMYEFMPNGSLDKFLRGDGSRLDWNTLFQIAIRTARGLEYLHRGCNTRIVHFDIKPHNILLDAEFVPKISDFGLAKLCKKKESIVSVTGARGTAGYMAPEVFFRDLGGASHRSDVYSYGMMILEMTGARKHNNASRSSTGEAYFPDWIYKQVEVGSNLKDYGATTEEEVKLARKMMVVGLWCIQYDPSDRPSISKVVEMLEGSYESLQVPPKRFWSSSTRFAQGISQLYMASSISEVQVSDC